MSASGPDIIVWKHDAAPQLRHRSDLFRKFQCLLARSGAILIFTCRFLALARDHDTKSLDERRLPPLLQRLLKRRLQSMKGIVFTEFLDFVQARHDEDFVDDMIYDSGLEDAHFTSVGTYEFADLAKLLGTYCKITDVPVSTALRAFGEHLALVFQSKFNAFYASHDNVFDFLAQVDGHIHVEVKKLYPDAQLPEFEVESVTPNSISLNYKSCRPLADLAVGLIEGSALYFNQAVTVTARQVAGQECGHSQIDVELVQ